MNELLTDLCKFVGYGPKCAKVIFIGTEEYTRDDVPRSYEERLEIQRRLDPFHDLGKLCEQLAKAHLYNPQESKPQPTWAPLCSVMLGISGKNQNEIADCGAIMEYQKKWLGRIPGDSLLAELFPVPKSRSDHFDKVHRELLGFSNETDAREYRQKVLRARQSKLAEVLKARFAEGQNSLPSLIVGYGRPWSNFEAIFEQVCRMEYDASDHRFKWATFKGCLFILTFHPKCQDERKFDAKVAGRIVEIYEKRLGIPPHTGEDA